MSAAPFESIDDQGEPMTPPTGDLSLAPTPPTFYDLLLQKAAEERLHPAELDASSQPEFSRFVVKAIAERVRTRAEELNRQPPMLAAHGVTQWLNRYYATFTIRARHDPHDAKYRLRTDYVRLNTGRAMDHVREYPEIGLAIHLAEEYETQELSFAATALKDVIAAYGKTFDRSRAGETELLPSRVTFK